MICLSLLLVNCAHKLTVPDVVSIDPAFQEYVDDFKAEALNQGVDLNINNLIINFTDNLDETTLGECMDYNRGTEGNPEININRQDWLVDDSVTNKIVMFHELGHCILWRGHITNWININGYSIVQSIMYPDIEYDSMYVDNWTYYMQELFHGI